MDGMDNNLYLGAGALFQVAVIAAVWIIGVIVVLRSRLEPLAAALWLAFCTLVPILGGLCAVIYFGLRSRQAKRKSDAAW